MSTTVCRVVDGEVLHDLIPTPDPAIYVCRICGATFFQCGFTFEVPEPRRSIVIDQGG